MWLFSRKPVKMSDNEVNRIASEIRKEFQETQRRKEQERLERERLERERKERERLEREQRERERKEREEREKQQRAEKGEEDERDSDVRYSLAPSSGKYSLSSPSGSYSLDWGSPEIAYEEITTRFVRQPEPTFVERVNRMMARKGLIAKDVYTAAQMDRKLFSKVMSDRNYKPSKDTCVSILMALKVNEDEAQSMLKSAGYALSDSMRDAAFNYFFSHAHYNIFDLNEVLYRMNEKPLGDCRF